MDVKDPFGNTNKTKVQDRLPRGSQMSPLNSAIPTQQPDALAAADQASGAAITETAKRISSFNRVWANPTPIAMNKDDALD